MLRCCDIKHTLTNMDFFHRQCLQNLSFEGTMGVLQANDLNKRSA
jgi:hypothetical protein